MGWLTLPLCQIWLQSHNLPHFEFVWVITLPAQARTTKFGPEVQNQLVNIRIVCGVDWIDMSNLTKFQNPVYLLCFCVFEILVKPAKTDGHGVFHILNGCAQICSPPRVVLWTVEQSSCIFSLTIAGFPILDSAIGDGFFNVSVGFRQIIHTSHAEILYANIRWSPKQQ